MYALHENVSNVIPLLSELWNVYAYYARARVYVKREVEEGRERESQIEKLFALRVSLHLHIVKSALSFLRKGTSCFVKWDKDIFVTFILTRQRDPSWVRVYDM